MRTAESVATGYSPAFLRDGRELRTVCEPRQDPKPPAAACHAFAAELTQHMQRALEFNRAHEEAATQSQKAYYDRRRRPKAFKIDDMVLRKKQTLSNASRGFSTKLSAMRAGPFWLVDQVGDSDFLLRDTAKDSAGSGPRRSVGILPWPLGKSSAPGFASEGGRTTTRGRRKRTGAGNADDALAVLLHQARNYTGPPREDARAEKESRR